ncbi:MAG: tyrosine-type recombinase/integrase [Methylococcaceae bacterium]|nr:tyrosine-type recombinase/integrase [Methylococcaceae bacterium]
MANLNDIQIKNWIKNNERFESKADGDGLCLSYRHNFLTPRWNFRYRFAGKQRITNIGTYGQLTLADARKKAKELRARVSLGYDVASEKQERKTSAIDKINASKNAQTFGQLADIYYDKMIVGRWKNPSVIKSRIDKDIKPLIGNLAVEDVKPAHIDTMLQTIILRGSPTVANDILRWTKRIFDYAIKRHLVEHNPAAAFNRSDAGGKGVARERVLSKAELVSLFEAMRNTESFTPTNLLTVKLLLLLAIRKSELVRARRDEFDLNAGVWNLPADRTKTSTAITIPLSTQAVETLRAIMVLSEGSEWLLPARKMQSRKVPHIHENTINMALEKVKRLMDDSADFCVHDFRRTARSHLAALGVDSHIAERCLNHKLKGIEGVYNHHDYLDERRKALDLWAGLLTACEQGKDWNVTPIKKRATH